MNKVYSRPGAFSWSRLKSDRGNASHTSMANPPQPHPSSQSVIQDKVARGFVDCFAVELRRKVADVHAVFAHDMGDHLEILTVADNVTMASAKQVLVVQSEARSRFPDVDAYFELRRREQVDLDE